MNSLLITNARVIDPASGTDASGDLLILDGKIAALGTDARSKAPKDIETLDVKGAVVCPGLIDSHVHLREPGQSAKETIGTGTLAAARGGFTSVLCMPNTTPAIDNAATVVLVREKAEKSALINVYISGAITKGIAGEELAPIGSLKAAGVVAITDDGHCVQNNEIMRRAMEYARMFDLPVLDHCQDYALVSDGVIHEGYYSTELGLRGWPAIGEEVIVARNILLAELTGTHVHCQHLSSARSVRLIREAKERGIPISGEACPHHFVLTDAAIAGSEEFWKADGEQLSRTFPKDHPLPSWPLFDTNFKMNPPLRSPHDRDALIEGLADGTLEILGSDHAPHCDFQKEVEFDYAPFGITGLETELSLCLMQLYHTGKLTLPKLLEKMTVNPAKLLKIEKGTLDIGADADVTIFDPDRAWVYRREDSASKSPNSPFHLWPMRGKALATVVDGRIVWKDAEF
ncbi:MAG: dihydroorotase [Limisphaerales bacterium]